MEETCGDSVRLTFDGGGVGVVAGIGDGNLGPIVGVGNLADSSVEANVQAFTEAHRHTRVTIPHCRENTNNITASVKHRKK